MRSVRFILILSGLISLSFLTETWYLLDSNNFGFSILFPQKPAEEAQVIPSAVGELKLNMYIYDASADDTDENLIYLVNYTEYPDSLFAGASEEKITKMLRGSVDGMLSNVEGKLISEKVIELNGFPGREIKASIQNATAIINVRFYLVRNKMYLIETITDATKDSNQSMSKFLNSFKLK